MAIDLDSIFLFLVYFLIFIFPLIINILSSKNKSMHILGSISILSLIYPLMIVYSGLPNLGIRINYSDIAIILLMIMSFSSIVLMLLLEKDNNVSFKIYLFSLIIYALTTLLDKFGILDIILNPFNIENNDYNTYIRIKYLIKQDLIILSSWMYYFSYLKDNLFISRNNYYKQIRKSNFILIWLLFSFIGLERLYYRKNKNITNFQLLSTACFISLPIYSDIASALSINNGILYYILIFIFTCKVIVWIYSLVQFLNTNYVSNNEVIKENIVA